MFETAIEKNYSLGKAISIILGDVNKSVKEELLIHSEKDIFRIGGRLMIINRKLMENDPDSLDRLAYYDRLAVYEKSYVPITWDEKYKKNISKLSLQLIFIEKEEDQEQIERIEKENPSNEDEQNEEKNSQSLHQIKEMVEEEKENLNESHDDLVIQKQNYKTFMLS